MPTGFETQLPSLFPPTLSSPAQVDRDAQLLRALKTGRDLYDYWPYGKYSEAASFEELVQMPLLLATGEINYQKGRVDTMRDHFVQISNLLRSEVDAAESQVSAAREASKSFSLIRADENYQYEWFVETFETVFKTDLERTSVLVDSDLGLVSLFVSQNELLSKVHYEIDRPNSVGLPGNNLELSSRGMRGSDTSPLGVYKKDTDTHANLDTLTDNDPTSWFEWERNYIYNQQPAKVYGQAWVYSQGEGTQRIKPYEATEKLDWGTFIHWPNEPREDRGPKENGYPLAQFVNGPWSENFLTSSIEQEGEAFLTLYLILDSPQSVSFIRLLPFVDSNAYPLVKSIEFSPDFQNWFPMASNDKLGEGLGISLSEKARAKGLLEQPGKAQAIYQVPTTKPLQALKVVIQGARYKPVQGFGHQFKALFIHERKDTSYAWGLVHDVNHNYYWKRVSLGEVPIAQVSEKNSWLGTLAIGAAIGVALPKLGGILATRILGSLGVKLAAGASVPVLGWIAAGLALLNMSGFISTKTEVTIEKEQEGTDVFTGERSYIGLRELNLARSHFEKSGEYYSKAIHLSNPVSKVTLYTTEQIPQEWPQGRWIRYYLSTNGQSWSEILPINQGSDINAQIWQSPFPTNTLYLKASFSRPETDELHSPLLMHYALQGLKGD